MGTPVAMYASSMATQSLKSLRMKMECIRFDSAKSGRAQGGTTCDTVLITPCSQTHVTVNDMHGASA